MEAVLIVGGELRADGASSDGERRIVETVSRLLQVRELAVLMGSGASMHLGSPAIRRMTVQALLELLQDHVSEREPAVDGVLELLVGDQEVDLEEVLATVSTAIAFASSTGTDEVPIEGAAIKRVDLVALQAALNLGLARACDLPLATATSADPWFAHREFFRRLLQSRRSDLPRPWVFTTNYDVVIERTLDDAGVVYLDGFAGTIDRTMRLDTYQYDLYTPPAVGDRRLLRVPNVVRIAKLHGSINWRSVPSPSGRGTRRVVQKADRADVNELALIYPTPHKESDVVGHPYADLLRLFGSALTSSETALLCIGYGFADEHINRLIFQALPSNPTLQVLVVDPVGVYEGGAFGASAVAGLAQIADQRIAVLTGLDTKFETFAAACMPDPERFEPRGDTLDALANALLGARAAESSEVEGASDAEPSGDDAL